MSSITMSLYFTSMASGGAVALAQSAGAAGVGVVTQGAVALVGAGLGYTATNVSPHIIPVP